MEPYAGGRPQVGDSKQAVLAAKMLYGRVGPASEMHFLPPRGGHQEQTRRRHAAHDPGKNPKLATDTPTTEPTVADRREPTAADHRHRRRRRRSSTPDCRRPPTVKAAAVVVDDRKPPTITGRRPPPTIADHRRPWPPPPTPTADRRRPLPTVADRRPPRRKNI